MEGAPILCRRCGAPTDPQPDLTVRCRFCGTLDRLPPDELGRALEIRGRLTLAADQATQLAASEAALASLFERPGAFWSVLGPFPPLAAAVVLYAVWSVHAILADLPAAVPRGVRAQLVTSAALGPMFVLGLTVSVPFALWMGRRAYRRNVRGQLAARVPFYPGAPMRCRACGADLPVERGAFVTCRFCRSQNLLGTVAAAAARQQLDAEAAQFRARASAALTQTSRTGLHMNRVLTIAFVTVYLGVFALAYAGAWLASWLG